MYYEINIALNGRHFFATDERSITDLKTFYTVFDVLNKKFPESEGYSLSASYNPERSIGNSRQSILEHIEKGITDHLFEWPKKNK